MLYSIPPVTLRGLPKYDDLHTDRQNYDIFESTVVNKYL